MRSAIFIACFAALAAPWGLAYAANEGDREFEALAERYLDEIILHSPVNATAIGDHRADDRLDEVDDAARARLREAYRSYRDALAAIDRGTLSRANQVDADLLSNRVDSILFSLDMLEEWAWNPLYYVNISGSSVYGLLSRDFAPLAERLDNVAARLEQLPRFLEQARSSLQPERVPKIHAETAVRQNPGLVSIIDALVVPELPNVPDATRDRLEAAIGLAREAIAVHQSWLEEELLPRAAGDFRVGAELYDQKLAYAMNSPLDRKTIRALAESEYEAVRGQMYELAREIYAGMHPLTAFPDEPDEAYKQAIIRAALEQAYRELPPRVACTDDPNRTDPALNSVVPGNPRLPYDMKDIIKSVLDNNQFLEIHRHFAANMVVGFGRLNGMPVGIVANQPRVLAGCLDCDASVKCAR